MSAIGEIHDFPDVRLPPKAKFGGYLYVILFANGLVKVGCSANPISRIAHHRQASESFGIEAVRVWVSPLHDGHLGTEQKLIAQAEVLGGQQIRKEYFQGLNFDVVVRAAQRLEFPPVDVAAHEAFRAAKPPLFGPLKDIDEALQRSRAYDPHRLIGILFGRRPDGSYGLPSPDRDEAIPLGLIHKMAELSGEGFEEILGLDWTDLMRRMIHAVVDCEAAELKHHILTIGRHDLRLPLEEFVEDVVFDEDSEPDADLAEQAWATS